MRWWNTQDHIRSSEEKGRLKYKDKGRVETPGEHGWAKSQTHNTRDNQKKTGDGNPDTRNNKRGAVESTVLSPRSCLCVCLTWHNCQNRGQWDQWGDRQGPLRNHKHNWNETPQEMTKQMTNPHIRTKQRNGNVGLTQKRGDRTHRCRDIGRHRDMMRRIMTKYKTTNVRQDSRRWFSHRETCSSQSLLQYLL